MSLINTGKLRVSGLSENVGIIIPAPNQPAHKFEQTSEAVTSIAFLRFIEIKPLLLLRLPPVPVRLHW